MAQQKHARTRFQIQCFRTPGFWNSDHSDFEEIKLEFSSASGDPEVAVYKTTLSVVTSPVEKERQHRLKERWKQMTGVMRTKR